MLGYHELLQKACSTDITVTTNQVLAVEAKTEDQTGLRLWFPMRTGRITASKFKSACRTGPASPSLSLIMAICHPETCCFSTSATKWGCQHAGLGADTGGGGGGGGGGGVAKGAVAPPLSPEIWAFLIQKWTLAPPPPL